MGVEEQNEVHTWAEELLKKVVPLNGVAELVVAELQNDVRDLVSGEPGHLAFQDLGEKQASVELGSYET